MSISNYILRRAALTVVTLFAISIVSFFVINAPPGDWVNTYINRLQEQGTSVDEAQIAAIRAQFGLDKPLVSRYFRWMGRILLHGDFGRSFQYERPVTELLLERVPTTVFVSGLALIVSYSIAIPVGIYSATHQYSVGDFVTVGFTFIGVAVPGFIIALVLMWLSYQYTGEVPVGLVSIGFRNEPWTWLKVVDTLKHLPIPLLVIGIGGTAGTIRVMRGVLLDELRKPYVVMARAKGLKEGRLLLKYPVHVAMNPIISGTAYILPSLLSGSTIVSIVLDLPTIGPLLFSALVAQDMYLAGSCILMLSVLTMLGVIMADILLSIVDPRIRLER